MRTLSIIGLSALALGATTFIACDSVTEATGISSPESRLAGHIEDMAKIMEDNEDEPADGVEELHEYMQDNLPSMMEAMGKCMVEVDKIEDPEDRAERIEEIAEALEDPIKTFTKPPKILARLFKTMTMPKNTPKTGLKAGKTPAKKWKT